MKITEIPRPPQPPREFNINMNETELSILKNILGASGGGGKHESIIVDMYKKLNEISLSQIVHVESYTVTSY